MEKKNKKSLLLQIWQAKYLYLCILPMIVWVIIFSYGPMYGVIIAFKDFKAKYGILGSEWVGFDNFEMIFKVDAARQAILTTLEISFGRLAFCFPMGIVVAILLTEMRGKNLKKVCQTVLTFPHFLSWVIVGSLMSNFLRIDGAVNSLLGIFGVEPIPFLREVSMFKPILYLTDNWKTMGWDAIIFMAAIAGIDPTLYEAAEIDGASRLQRIWHITLPGISTTIVVMLVLAVGGIMNAGFDQIFNLRNDIVADVANILDTYIYDITFLGAPDYSFSAAVGLFKSLIGCILLITTNKIAKAINGSGIIG